MNKAIFAALLVGLTLTTAEVNAQTSVVTKFQTTIAGAKNVYNNLRGVVQGTLTAEQQARISAAQRTIVTAKENLKTARKELFGALATK